MVLLSADPDVDGVTPDYHKQTEEAHGHSLTAVDEGRFFDLTWKCRICGESRPSTAGFVDVDCD